MTTYDEAIEAAARIVADGYEPALIDTLYAKRVVGAFLDAVGEVYVKVEDELRMFGPPRYTALRPKGDN